jgi:RecA/RadA recombinase
MLPFLNKFKKTIDKLETVYTSFGPPDFWYNTGNYAINKIMSGSFTKGIPQGRITCLAGPSGAGKSFLLCNILRDAQKQGAFVLVLDSENALDDNFMSAIGIDTSPDKLMYVGVTLFSDVVSVISDFIQSYEKEYGKDNPNSPKVVIALDSLDMLLTDSEVSHFESGVQKGDQGQRAKQSKHMLRTAVSRIKRLPMAMIVTHQVYANSDLLNGEGNWIINNAIRYSVSQILLITKLKLREAGEVLGIRMRVECFKSRFAKLGSRVEVDVPYTKGMSPYSGFLDLMEAAGIVTSAGAWKTLVMPDEQIKFQSKQLNEELVSKMLSHPKITGEEIAITTLIDSMSEDPEQELQTEAIQ